MFARAPLARASVPCVHPHAAVAVIAKIGEHRGACSNHFSGRRRRDERQLPKPAWFHKRCASPAPPQLRCPLPLTRLGSVSFGFRARATCVSHAHAIRPTASPHLSPHLLPVPRVLRRCTIDAHNSAEARGAPQPARAAARAPCPHPHTHRYPCPTLVGVLVPHLRAQGRSPSVPPRFAGSHAHLKLEICSRRGWGGGWGGRRSVPLRLVPRGRLCYD